MINVLNLAIYISAVTHRVKIHSVVDIKSQLIVIVENELNEKIGIKVMRNKERICKVIIEDAHLNLENGVNGRRSKVIGRIIFNIY